LRSRSPEPNAYPKYLGFARLPEKGKKDSSRTALSMSNDPGSLGEKSVASWPRRLDEDDYTWSPTR